MNDQRTSSYICAVSVPSETNKEQIAALAARGEQIKTNSAEFLWVCRAIRPPLLPDKPIAADPNVDPAHAVAAAPALPCRAHNETTPMTTRETHIYRLDIGHGTSDTLPPRQTKAQQNGTAYIWHSTTQELLPILPPDHSDYETNVNMVMAAIRRWNGEAK